MRIVHTSDWHAGRIWKGVKRLDELQRVLEHLAEYIEREAVDVVLHSGDVFDSGVPSAEAERTVFRFFRRVGQSGARAVVIAGNHDSPLRLEAWGQLTELVNVHIVSRPLRAEQGGVLELETRTGDRAVVAALPFAATRFLVSALEQTSEDESVPHGLYAERMAELIGQLTSRFRKDTVNLLVAHTHLEGAAFSGSERRIHVSADWAARPEALPPTASYVALGHIHRPQAVLGSEAPAYYAGSPLQLDFGEAGEEKSFVSVQVQAGKPARIECVPYVGGTPLKIVRRTLESLEADAAGLRESGWLKVSVVLDSPHPDLNALVRRLVPNAVAVEMELPKYPQPDVARPPVEATPIERYAAFHRLAHGREADDEVLEAFRALYEGNLGEGAQ